MEAATGTINAVTVAVPDFEQGRDRITDIADPEFGLVAHLGEGQPQGLRLANLQSHDSVGIDTGPYGPVHGRRHRTDDRVANSLRGEELRDVGH